MEKLSRRVERSRAHCLPVHRCKHLHWLFPGRTCFFGGLVLRSSLLLVGSILSLSLLSGCSGGSDPNGNPTPPPTPPTSAVNPAPTISSISPGSIVAGSPSQTVTFTRTGYIASTGVALNSTALQTKYVSTMSLQVVVPASALASGQIVSFVASNPSPGGGNSAAASFSIMSPTPILTGLSPQTVPQGAAATVTVNGSGFEANSVVMWNGVARPTVFVNGTTLQVSLTAMDLQSYGTGQITINNPRPGGTTTTPTELVVAANLPTIFSVNPSSVTVNASSNVPVSVNISGSGFAANATVQANGQFVPVSSQSTTNISIWIPSTFFTSAGSIQIVVSNPGSPAVQSNSATVTVATRSRMEYHTPQRHLRKLQSVDGSYSGLVDLGLCAGQHSGFDAGVSGPPPGAAAVYNVSSVCQSTTSSTTQSMASSTPRLRVRRARALATASPASIPTLASFSRQSWSAVSQLVSRSRVMVPSYLLASTAPALYVK